MTPEEHADRVSVDGVWNTTAGVDYDELRRLIAAAIRDAVKAEREACELIAMRYRDKMARSASERRYEGLPTDVAVSKFDAADAIAVAIRERPL